MGEAERAAMRVKGLFVLVVLVVGAAEEVRERSAAVRASVVFIFVFVSVGMRWTVIERCSGEELRNDMYGWY